MSKTHSGNFFEDFSLGQTLVHATPRTVSEADQSLYIALTGDRHLVASSRPAAHALGFRDRPLDDLLAFHLAFGKTVNDISLNAVANLGYADVRFLKPVYPGDTLSAESTVIGLKENSTGKSGVVWVRSTALNQNGEEVLTWIRWVMVHKRDASHPAPTPVVPELPTYVKPERLSLPSGLDCRDFETRLTGGPWLWDDYAAGERIDHPAGMTLDESDHTFATRLYQNNARLHFDAHMMAGSPFKQRLVYGGHVISVCRALSFEGLENALLIVAINAGQHANPTLAGDTLYARSEVIETWALPGRDDVGALRLRLVGLKNMRPEDLAEVMVEVEGRQKHHPNVVLDLDYTVLMPRGSPA
ncbi:MAG: MaoC family dehydratase [Hydrogenophilales bacterium]|nr:MaoC family dehydratase [Hydrogenophilales bacterium]